MPAIDLLIRGGTIVDGLGGAPFTGNVAISGGMIMAVGKISGNAARVIDADGALVTPGFVDAHTHYDGQATWDSALAPSSWHGVTTVVFGNCGVGFAPVKQDDRQTLIDLMESVEEIPGTALHAGLRWDWTSFPEYLDALERIPHDIDFAALLPHNALRLNVMGQRASADEPATRDDIDAMGRIVSAALDAGALGFSTSRTYTHKTLAGDCVPSYRAHREELVGIGRYAAGRGVLQLVSDMTDVDTEFGHFRAVAQATGTPVIVPVGQRHEYPDMWRRLLAEVDNVCAEGHTMWAQVAARPVGVMLGLDATTNPFSGIPAYEALTKLPLAERVVRLRDPEVRRRILAGVAEPRQRTLGFSSALQLTNFSRMYPLGEPPQYEPAPEESIAALAARKGRDPADLAYDMLLNDNGQTLLYYVFFNYADGDLEAARQMMAHPRAVISLGDGGAHVGSICDSTYTTTLLAHWVRDRTRGPRLPLARAIQGLTSRPADMMRLHDRGRLVPGCKADINVIDLDTLQLHKPYVTHDLPQGGRRIMQRASGYVATVVSGIPIYFNGVPTGEQPGKLVRKDWKKEMQ